jgi:hypothetical protein
MKTSLSLGIVGVAALIMAQPVQAGSRGGGGRSFGGGSHFSGGSRSYSGGARYGGGGHYSSGASSRGSYGGGSRYTAAGGARYSPTTHFRNPTYSTSGRQWSGNRNGSNSVNRAGALNGNHTTAYNSFGRTRQGGYRSGGNHSSGFNNQRVVARHSASQHPNWSRNRDHNWHGRRCHFHNGFWYLYDPFPWYGYSYPYYADYYPYETSYDPGYDSGAYYDDGTGQDNRQYSQDQNVSGSQVTAVQRALAREGYYDGAVDGVFGAGTRRALRKYQRDRGLEVTGGITQSVIESLRVR